MPGINLWFKAALVILLAIGGVMFYRVQHPAATFGADGRDPYWDAVARTSHDVRRPAVVLFSAGWCPACQRLHEVVLSRPDVQAELDSHYCFCSVDLTNPSPAARTHAKNCGVSAIPLMIRFDAEGNETDRTNYVDGEQMIAWLKAGE